MTAKTGNIEAFKTIEDVVKDRMNFSHVIIAGVNEEGDHTTFFSPDMLDSDFIYLLQVLKDRRNVNESE